MSDNSTYWTDQSGWYQQPGPPPMPPASYQSPYPSQGPPITNDPNNQTTPSPHNNLQQTHLNQAAHHQIPPTSMQPQHPSPPRPMAQHQHRPTPHMHPQPVTHNGMSNGNMPMQSGIHPQQGMNPQQPLPQMNHYGPQNSTHVMHQHDQINSGPMPQQQIPSDSAPNYPMHQNPAYQQQPPPPLPPQQQHPPVVYKSEYAQPPNSYINPIPPQAGPNTLMPNIPPQQQHPVPPQSQGYPQQQYSPAPYWNNQMMPQNQSGYGQPHSLPQTGPPSSASQGSSQSIPTPPSAIQDTPAGYNPVGPSQPHGPPHSNMPYDSRSANMTGSYNSNYQQQQSYYNPHEQLPQPNEPPVNYDMSHPPSSQQSWSNGYYQPSHSPYSGVMNPYPVPYNGNSNTVQHPPQPPQSHQMTPLHAQPLPPQQLQPSQPPPPHYNQGHPNPYPHQAHPNHLHLNNQIGQPSQQWPNHNNHNVAIIERSDTGEKKPVKPRAPKKQPNPNAPNGRRKKSIASEDNKKSGYTKFYQKMRKELPKDQSKNFGVASKSISQKWNELSDIEKSVYAKDVTVKRKDMLKKKANQQAQDLVKGINQEQDVLIQEVKNE